MSDHIAKIESLLLSDDLSFVIQGFELLKTLPSVDFTAFSFSVRWVDNYQYSHFSISKECAYARYVGCALRGMRLLQDASFTPKKPTTRMHFEGPIPPEIGAFKDLTSLTISLPYGNGIKEYSIPGEITHLPKLHTLTATLHGAKLQLPENIGSSTSLTKIHLESDTPISVPMSFGSLRTLETLKINHLAGSEMCLDGLTSLQSLNLSHYSSGFDSSTVPNLFTKPHPTLTNIKLYDTSSTLPSWLTHLPLQKLELDAKNLKNTSFPSDIFPTLEILKFRCKGIYTLDNAFLTYPNLKEVEISHSGTHCVIPRTYKHATFQISINNGKCVFPIDLTYSQAFNSSRNVNIENPDRHMKIFKHMSDKPMISTQTHDREWHVCSDQQGIPSTANKIDATDIYEPLPLLPSIFDRDINGLRIDLDNDDLYSKVQEASDCGLRHYYNPSAKSLPTGVSSLGLAHDQIKLLRNEHDVRHVYIELKYANKRCIDLTPLTQFELESLDISDHRLSFEGDCLPEGLTALYLSKDMFLKFQNTLPKSLKYLSLTGYQLTKIPECIYTLPNLTRLDLSGNNLTELPDKLFELTNLELLNLSGNDLADTDKLHRLSNLRNLKYLYLNVMGLTDLPDLSSLRSLIQFEVFGNQIEQVSTGHFPKQVEQIDLSHNCINTFNGDLKHCGVTHLDISFNALVEMCEVPANTTLYLMHNPHLEHLPQSMGELLQVDKEQIQRLRPLLKDRVCALDLSRAGVFETYEQAVQRVQKNETLVPLSEKDVPSFAGFTRLQGLILDHNGFTHIPVMPSSIEFLYMNHNELGKDTGTTVLDFEGPTECIFSLSVSHNPSLKSINVTRLLDNLYSLYIDNCNFDDIPDIIGNGDGLEEVKVAGNPFRSLTNIEKLPSYIIEDLREALFTRLFPPSYKVEYEGGDFNHHCLISERDDLPFEILEHYVLNELNGSPGHSRELATFEFLGVLYKVTKYIHYQWEEQYSVEHTLEPIDDFTSDQVKDWFCRHYEGMVNDDLVSYFNPLTLGKHLKQLVPTPSQEYWFNDVDTAEICNNIESLKEQFITWSANVSIDFHLKRDNKHFLNETVCTNANLDNMALQNIQFSGVNFCGTSLQNTDFTDSMLHACNLCGADLTGSNLRIDQLGDSKINGYWASSRRNFSLYDKHTTWPAGFDPTESQNLVEINMPFYRVVRARYMSNLRKGSWNWSLSDFDAVLKPFGIRLDQDEKTTIPKPFMASFEEIMGHFVSPNPSLNSLFSVGECDHIENPTFDLKPIRERFEDEEMDQEYHGFWRNERSTEHMLWMFQDGVLIENSFHADDWDAAEPNKATVDLLEFKQEQTWVVLTNRLSHWNYADENFDLSGTFEYTFFDNKEDAYAEWLRIDQDHLLTQKKHNISLLQKWSNLLSADDWSRYFRTVFGINSPMWLKLFQEPERFEALCTDFGTYCDEVIEQWKNAGNKE